MVAGTEELRVKSTQDLCQGNDIYVIMTFMRVMIFMSIFKNNVLKFKNNQLRYQLKGEYNTGIVCNAF